MPGSLNYSPSGSEGGRSFSATGGDGVADSEKSPAGLDLITTPRTTPRKGSRRSSVLDDAPVSVEGHGAVRKSGEQEHDGRLPPKSVIRKRSTSSTGSAHANGTAMSPLKESQGDSTTNDASPPRIDPAPTQAVGISGIAAASLKDVHREATKASGSQLGTDGSDELGLEHAESDVGGMKGHGGGTGCEPERSDVYEDGSRMQHESVVSNKHDNADDAKPGSIGSRAAVAELQRETNDIRGDDVGGHRDATARESQTTPRQRTEYSKDGPADNVSNMRQTSSNDDFTHTDSVDNSNEKHGDDVDLTENTVVEYDRRSSAASRQNTKVLMEQHRDLDEKCNLEGSGELQVDLSGNSTASDTALIAGMGEGRDVAMTWSAAKRLGPAQDDVQAEAENNTDAIGREKRGSRDLTGIHSVESSIVQFSSRRQQNSADGEEARESKYGRVRSTSHHSQPVKVEKTSKVLHPTHKGSSEDEEQAQVSVRDTTSSPQLEDQTPWPIGRQSKDKRATAEEKKPNSAHARQQAESSKRGSIDATGARNDRESQRRTSNTSAESRRESRLFPDEDDERSGDREPQSPPLMSRRTYRRRSSTAPIAVGGRADLDHREMDKLRMTGSQTDGLSIDTKARPSPCTATHHPPPLTPTRERRSSSARRTTSPPLSPVAIAARAISLEESVISTARMKQAAEAVALEDHMRNDSSRLEREAMKTRESDWCEESPKRDSTENDTFSLDSDSDALERQRRRDNRRAEVLEERRLRSLRAKVARRDAEIERDRALELTLEVLKRKRGQGREGMRGENTMARMRARSPPRRSRRPQNHRSQVAKRIKDSAARSCGLSQTQVVLLRCSRETSKKQNSNNHSASSEDSKPLTRGRREILAQPKEKRPATRIRDPLTEPMIEELTLRMSEKQKKAFLYACLADAKECTHRPRTRGSSSRRDGGGDEEDDPGAKDAFLYRMDAQERAKKTAMEHRRGELAYKATLDKRVCPQCGAEQSYDEVQEKRKTCPNCEVEYRKPRTWTGVRKGFFRRVADFEESKRASREAAAAQQDCEARNGRDPVFWEDVEDDFNTRLQEDAIRRQESVEFRSKSRDPDWTFQPTVSPASERLVEDSPWSGMTFLERVEGDLQRRREAPYTMVSSAATTGGLGDHNASRNGQFAFQSFLSH